MKSNYDKSPRIRLPGDELRHGWEDIAGFLGRQITHSGGDRPILVIECYTGVLQDEVLEGIRLLNPVLIINSEEAFRSEEEIIAMTQPDVTEDALFGYMTRLRLENFLSAEKIEQIRARIRNVHTGLIVICGQGASLVPESWDQLVYADMARWEIQNRMKKGLVHGLGVDDHHEDFNTQYKRGYFVDWRVCDRHKKEWFHRADYFLDTNTRNDPKMISRETLFRGLRRASTQPFRVVPFFDPGPWGGQWLKDVCDLDRNVSNYAWCFDCVPEENSLLFEIGNVVFEIPSVNVVFFESRNLLGELVEARFGQEFPIRFDFLDTMEGGNLSFQVHPTTQYIRETFGMPYTQDESYYIMATGEDACVFLGTTDTSDPVCMFRELRQAHNGGPAFHAEKHVNRWQAKKHDHFLIPAGTVHCSGKNCVVLEISATPYIFTFKMWDWGRLGLDGRPRPINIDHAERVINWNMRTKKVRDELIDRFGVESHGEDWIEESTGLHRKEFIETRRHWFTGKVLHKSTCSVNVLNLVEGKEVLVESPDHAFEPFAVHYAETFIIPAAAGDYTIRPYRAENGERLATIKAYVRG